MSNEDKAVSVLFVCMGNICRSPTAEGVFRHHVLRAGLEDTIRIDSAGTHAFHVGNLPDSRASAAAGSRGYSLENIQARPIVPVDFEVFDFILAMDNDNLTDLRNISDSEYHKKIHLFLSFAKCTDRIEVPDPYYGSEAGFERVLDLVEDASAQLLEQIQTDL